MKHERQLLQEALDALAKASDAPGGAFVTCKPALLRLIGTALAEANRAAKPRLGRPSLTSPEKWDRARIAGDLHELRILGWSNSRSIAEIQRRHPGVGASTIEKAARQHRDLLPLIDISGDISDKQIAAYKARIVNRSKNGLKSRK